MRLFLTDNLAADGLHVLPYACADTAWGALAGRYPDAVILDAGLPDRQGHVLLEHLRDPAHAHGRVDVRLPILVLGAQTDLDRVRVLDAGADDAQSCPFSYPELRSRLTALLRRTQDRARSGALRIGALEVDPVSHQARLAGVRIDLSAKEFALLRTLAAEPTRVFTKPELLRGIWGYRDQSSTRTLDSHACRLRSKLAAAGDRLIVNVWGVGYRLCDPAPS